MATFFENIFSKCQFGFRKGYSSQHCLITFIELWRKCLDNKESFGALLTDLSKAFDCVNNELIIAKLHAYGLSYSALKLIQSYLSKRKQKVRINNSFSSLQEIEHGVPQGSILGPLFFNIHMSDLFLVY